MIAAIHLTLAQVAGALALVATAAAVSIWQHADLERDIAIATIRSFIQLTAIGYVIKLIFDQNQLVFVIALIAAMVLFGALTARRRARRVPHAFWPLLIALALAGASTLALVVALGVFPARARYLVPVGGMVIGNAMTAAAVTLNRLGDDVADGASQIEATLALGATSSQAIQPMRHPRRAALLALGRPPTCHPLKRSLPLWRGCEPITRCRVAPATDEKRAPAAVVCMTMWQVLGGATVSSITAATPGDAADR